VSFNEDFMFVFVLVTTQCVYFKLILIKCYLNHIYTVVYAASTLCILASLWTCQINQFCTTSV